MAGVDGFSERLIERSGYGAEGFAVAYDGYRPAPPGVVMDVLQTHAGGGRPGLVIDLGCGTGLSTRAWSDRAIRVVGVEANRDMAAHARAVSADGNVEFVERLAADTGLPSSGADIVTCAQSFHWMEPQPVLAEAARILRGGGVFAAYDYDVVPVVEPRVDAAFAAHVAARSRARTRLGIEAGSASRPKHRHIDQIRSCASFGFAREVQCHGRGTTNAERLVGLAHSIGGPIELFEENAPEVQDTLATLAETAHQVLADRSVPALIGYTIRLGIRL
jgi:SAM-dependent methyltransferase